jgi:protein-L-isoaspartate(D-aspartate) O-methyltransferase
MKHNWPIPLVAALCLSGCPEEQAVATEGQSAKADHHAQARREMVAIQIRARGVENPRVLAATAMHSLAYADRPLPIGHGQTISQPFIVAFMTEALKPAPADKVLEIGTGSGYQAAVLAELVAQVYTIEIVKPLGERAREDLARLGYANVHVRVGDGYEGWPENAPFDAIIVTCSPEQVPQPLVDQLREGGRMVIPVGTQAGGQDLYLLEKRGGKVVKQAILPVRFVPMTGKAQGR